MYLDMKYIHCNIEFYLMLIFFIIILQSRLKMIGKLPESVQQIVAKLNSSLNGKVGHTTCTNIVCQKEIQVGYYLKFFDVHVCQHAVQKMYFLFVTFLVLRRLLQAVRSTVWPPTSGDSSTET